jgi:NitT/TauT family transport system substrate-binding protein
MNLPQSLFGRRRFLAGAAGLGLSAAGGGLLSGCQNAPSARVDLNGSLETTRLRVIQTGSLCISPQFVAQDLLRGEGFADLEYVKKPGASGIGWGLASGEADISLHFAGSSIIQIDAGDPLVVLSGAHVGCFELFGTEQIRAIRDLRGKTVAIPEPEAPSVSFLASLLAHVGLRPFIDVNWAVHPPAEAMQLLAEGRVDGYMGFPPDPQMLRAKGIGHVIVNSLTDRPWSQYLCCLVVANRDFASRHPVATARALRGILNGIDHSGRDPGRTVDYLVAKGYTAEHGQALDAVKMLHSGGWRSEYDVEDTLRYYALRLHEAGMIKSTPDQVISRGTDWRYLAEVKRDRATAPSAAFFCPLPPADL